LNVSSFPNSSSKKAAQLMDVCETEASDYFSLTASEASLLSAEIHNPSPTHAIQSGIKYMTSLKYVTNLPLDG
jgi:hypothetical protein